MTIAWPSELLDRVIDQPVLIVGDFVLDEYLHGESSRLSPEAPVPVVRVGQVTSVLGGAANTAANVTSLGGRATLVGVCGDDEAGDRLAALADERGILLHAVRDARPTTRKTRVVGQQQQLLRLDRESTAAVSPAVEEEVLARVERALGAARIVVISDYAKGLLTARVCAAVLAAARRQDRLVVVDPRPQHAEFYIGCDYLTPNWKEALALLGRPESAITDGAVEEVGRALAERFGANIVLTLGGRGIAFFGRSGTTFSVPTVAREVYDVSGAGDTVVAALALALTAGAAETEAVAFANAAAGVVVGKRGTATVSRSELVVDLPAEARLLDRAALRPLADRLRAEGKRVVTINGSFDLLHYGHAHILQEARRLGDVLIVGVNSDASVRSYKGDGRPVVPERERARLLLALRAVDYVHVFDEPVPMPFLEEVRPAIHVNGSEYGERCIEAETVTRHGGRIHIVQRLEGMSTSEMIARASGAS